MNKVYIIAEAGVNHNGNLDTAMKMVEVAKAAGCDAVKFQTFTARNSISKFAPKAEYQKKTTGKDGSQLEMARGLELDKNAHIQLIRSCRSKKIDFLSSPFDLESADMLNRLGVKIFKIASGEIVNLPLLRMIGKLNREVIVSTGMTKLSEIEDALRVLNESGTCNSKISLLHCNTEYPTPMEDVNLLAMVAMKDRFGMRTGYSDHTLGIEVAIAAAALGADIVEKHFTLDKKMRGPDHKSSLDPAELNNMVLRIRNIEKALGNGFKKPSPSELKNRGIARKSIVAGKNINKGDLLTDENITVKRPGTGISPMLWDEVIGRRAKRDFKEDRMLEI